MRLMSISVTQNVAHAFTSIARTERLPGLFRGLGPTLLTNAPFSALYYLFYKELQTRLARVRSIETRRVPLLRCCLSLLYARVHGVMDATKRQPVSRIRDRNAR